MENYYSGSIVSTGKNFFFDSDKLHYFGYTGGGCVYGDDSGDEVDVLAYVNLYAKESYMGDFAKEKEELENNPAYTECGCELINGFEIEYWMNNDKYLGFFNIDDAYYRITIDNKTIPESEFGSFETAFLEKALILK